MGDLQQLRRSVIEAHKIPPKGTVEKVVGGLVSDILGQGVSPRSVLEELVSAMGVVGQRFRDNEYFLPEVLLATKAIKAALGVLEPELVRTGVRPVGTSLIGTVRGDLHDLGKNLVAMLLRGAGFKVIDLGVDVPAEKFVAQARQEHVQLICLSALLTTTMHEMRKTVHALKAEGIPAKTLVGGAPVTESFATEIGADGYAPDAVTAVERARCLLGGAGQSPGEGE